MNVEIRQIFNILLIHAFLISPSDQRTLDKTQKVLEKPSETPRFSQSNGYGTVAEVEPSPNIRLYVYNPPNSFNPTNELFSKRTLREVENERFKDESHRIENEFSKFRTAQKRQLAMIIDAIEKNSKEKRNTI